jgi:hypothetical protein
MEEGSLEAVREGGREGEWERGREGERERGREGERGILSKRIARRQNFYNVFSI